jgi:hypothetical protein
MAPVNGTDPWHRDKIEDWDIVFGTTITYVEAELDSKAHVKVPRDVLIEMLATSEDTGRTVGKKILVASSVMPLGVRTWRVPFLIYGTGCEPLRISVRVTYHGRISSAMSNSIPFSCGE